VAKDNEQLKQELTYADYKTTKERHEKLVRSFLYVNVFKIEI